MAAALAATGLLAKDYGAGAQEPGGGRRPLSAAHWVESDPGVRIFVRDWGAGRPLLFVHGWPSSHQIFEYQLGPLAERGFRVVALDLRGFGASSKPWGGNNYGGWFRDIDAVITALDLRDVVLAGYSMGGALGMHYAAMTGMRRVSKLALLAAAGPKYVAGPDNPNGVPEAVIDGLAAAVASDRAGFLYGFTPSLFKTAASPDLARWMADLCMAASPHATLRALDEAKIRDLRPVLSTIETPTLILHSAADDVVPFALAEEQANGIRGARLLRFETAGHGLFYDERVRVNQALAEFAA